MWHSFLIIILIDFKNLASDIYADKFGRLQEKIGTECPGGEIAKPNLAHSFKAAFGGSTFFSNWNLGNGSVHKSSMYHLIID